MRLRCWDKKRPSDNIKGVTCSSSRQPDSGHGSRCSVHHEVVQEDEDGVDS